MLEIGYDQLYFDAEQGNYPNISVMPRAAAKENMRRYKTTAVALLGTMLLISTTAQVPLGAIAGYPL